MAGAKLGSAGMFLITCCRTVHRLELCCSEGQPAQGSEVGGKRHCVIVSARHASEHQRCYASSAQGAPIEGRNQLASSTLTSAFDKLSASHDADTSMSSRLAATGAIRASRLSVEQRLGGLEDQTAKRELDGHLTEGHLSEGQGRHGLCSSPPACIIVHNHTA
jgi:hypothetical protein